MILIPFTILCFGYALNNAKAATLSGTIFLPDDPGENPYFDEELNAVLQNASISRWHHRNSVQASK